MITEAAQEREHYLNASYGIKSWLLTKDHKRIALLYLHTITFFFFLGGIFATLIRLELLTPKGDLVSADTYSGLGLVPAIGLATCVVSAVPWDHKLSGSWLTWV